MGLGTVIFLTALVQFYYGLTKGYKERIDVNLLSTILKSLIYGLAGAGYLARGIIIGIIGFFFIKAGLSGKAHHIVNTEKAFDFIGDQIGPLCFILVAIGSICYGLFMFVGYVMIWIGIDALLYSPVLTKISGYLPCTTKA